MKLSVLSLMIFRSHFGMCRLLIFSENKKLQVINVACFLHYMLLRACQTAIISYFQKRSEDDIYKNVREISSRKKHLNSLAPPHRRIQNN